MPSSPSTNTKRKIHSVGTIEQRTFDYALYIFSLSVLLRKTSVFWDISRQILRSGSSIAANIAEAKYASSRKDFTYFYTIALKSAHETRFWLNFCAAAIKKVRLDNGIAETITTTCTEAIDEAIQIENILWASIRTLKQHMN